jgi:hypothetical protein
MFISTIFHKIKEIAFFIEPFLKNYRHFLPSGRADLTASASLQPIRSGLTTASWAAASPLQQSRLVNNPGYMSCYLYM